MADVSIVVPVYGVEQYLRASVQSMRNQTHKNIEIILVDDGSRTAAEKFVTSWQGRTTGFR